MRRFTLLSALATVLLLASTPRLPAPPLPPATGSADHSVERHLLDDTDLLVVVNFKEVVKSRFFTKGALAEVEKLLGRDEVKPYLKGAGIDPLKDVDQVVVCMGRSCFTGKQGAAREDGPVIVLQGRFDKAKIEKQLAKLAEDNKGVKAVEHGKAKFHRLGGGGPHVAALDKTALLVCGSKAQVAEQLSRVAGKSKAKLKYPAIAAFLKARGKSPPAIDAIALESMVTGESGAKRVGPGGAVEVETKVTTLGDMGFKRLTVEVRVKDDARGAVRMDVKKADELDGKVEKAKGSLAAMRRELDNPPPDLPDREGLGKLKDLVAGIKVRGEKGAVVFEGACTAEQAAALFKLYFGRFDRR